MPIATSGKGFIKNTELYI